MVQKVVDNCLKKVVSGFYVGGSTGESYLLSLEERREMLEHVVKDVDGRGDVIAKIGVFKGVKAALKLQGMDCGDCRKPLQPLRDDQVAELKLVLQENHKFLDFKP